MGLLLAGAAATPFAWAEEERSNDQLELVVVTARKLQEDLQRVPAALSVLSAEQIEDTHFSTIDDLAFLVPNLNITTRADNTPDVVIRGVGAFGVTEGVGFYVNDVQLFGGQTVRAEDLERIEVLKGPQGTLYGGNNIGGAIKYITRKPSAELTTEATAEFGNWGARNLSAAVSGPISGDSLKARLSAFDATHDGFVFDSTLNRYLGHSNQRGARLTLEHQGADTDVTLFLSGTRERSTNENLYYAPVNSETYSRATTANVSPHYDRDLYSPTLQIDHSFGDVVQLTSISSYFHSNIDARADGDHRAAPLFDVSQRFRQNNWSQEVRLASMGGGPSRWIVGAFVQGRNLRTFEDNTQMLSVITDNPADDGVVSSASRHTRLEYAAFGNASYDLNKWTFEGGLRIDHFRNQLADTLNAVTLERTGTEVLPKASLSYHFSEDVMGYVTLTRGLQPADVLQSHGEVSTFDSEKTQNYETGLKSTFFDQRLRFNVAAFYISYDNRLFSTIDGATLQEVTKNVGPSRNYGLEADVQARVTHELTLGGSFGMTRALWGNIPGYFNPNTGETLNLDGLKAPFTPSYQGTLTIDWRHPLPKDMTFGARIDASFTGPQWWNISDDYRQRAYQVLNAGVRLDVSERWRLSAHVSNLFDEQYNPVYAEGPDIGSPFNVAGFSKPRQWFVSLTFRQ
jgi:iron complex outermembrane receptor protein